MTGPHAVDGPGHRLTRARSRGERGVPEKKRVVSLLEVRLRLRGDPTRAHQCGNHWLGDGARGASRVSRPDIAGALQGSRGPIDVEDSRGVSSKVILAEVIAQEEDPLTTTGNHNSMPRRKGDGDSE